MDLSSLPIYNSASQVGSPVVQNPSNAAQNLVNSLQSKQGADLSKSYVEQALMLQNLSVMAAKITLAKTKDPAIIAIANEIIADAAKKIETLKKLLPPEPETNPNQ